MENGATSGYKSESMLLTIGMSPNAFYFAQRDLCGTRVSIYTLSIRFHSTKLLYAPSNRQFHGVASIQVHHFNINVSTTVVPFSVIFAKKLSVAVTQKRRQISFNSSSIFLISSDNTPDAIYNLSQYRPSLDWVRDGPKGVSQGNDRKMKWCSTYCTVWISSRRTGIGNPQCSPDFA